MKPTKKQRPRKHSAAAAGHAFAEWCEREGVVTEFERQYKRGRPSDKEALLQAVNVCLAKGLIAPPWIVAAFGAAMKKWDALEVDHLGDAFEIPKRKYREAKRKKITMQEAVYYAVLRGHEEIVRGKKVPIDDELYEKVGEDFGISGPLVKKYYDAEKPNQRELADLAAD